jgi:hypothetical protein
MKRASEKLLLSLLVLILVFLPLQGTMASFVSSSNAVNIDHSLMNMSSDMDMQTAMLSDSCDCVQHDQCEGHDCSSGHCASSFVALFPNAVLQSRLPAVVAQVPADLGKIEQPTSSLFRPPII